MTSIMGKVVKLVIALVVLAGVLFIGREAFFYFSLKDLQRSHIEAHSPEKEDFERFLVRDLASFAKEKYSKDCEVRYEFLRLGATQSGVSTPKYYLWVKIFEKSGPEGKMISEGAVRVGAHGKNSFYVTNYLTKQEIKDSPDSIHSVFPAPVCERIKTHL